MRVSDFQGAPYASEEFARVLDEHRGEWAPVVSGVSVDSARDLLVRYRELVCAENEVQNLTRILGPLDFYRGHVLDVVALHKSGFFSERNFDLGSGAGVPGLISACLNSQLLWTLGESEGRKADFLARAADALGLKNVGVATGRAEDTLLNQPSIRVISRAVGPVLRIFNWIEKCSTWNTLVLFKGPNWEEEWSEFQRSGKRSKLKLANSHTYEIPGPETKHRLIVELTRN